MTRTFRTVLGLGVLLAVLTLSPRGGAAQEIKLKLSHFLPAARRRG